MESYNQKKDESRPCTQRESSGHLAEGTTPCQSPQSSENPESSKSSKRMPPRNCLNNSEHCPSFKKKYVSIKKNREFQYLFKKGASVVTGAFVCYYRENRRRVNRLGIVASKKIGNSVTRSRARRVLREAFRLIEPEIRGKSDKRYDFIMVARGKTPYMKSDKICQIMRTKLLDSQFLSADAKRTGQGKKN